MADIGKAHRKIPEQLLSFEYSAPKTDEALEKLTSVHARLQPFQPHFCSVTHSARGSTKDGTRRTLLDLTKAGRPTAPHLPFGGDQVEVIDKLLETYKDAGL